VVAHGGPHGAPRPVASRACHSRLRGGSDEGGSPTDAALRFTRGCLVGLESERTAVGLLLPAFRGAMRYLGHGWVRDPTAEESREALVAKLPQLRGGVSNLVAKYATNISQIPKLTVDNSTAGAKGKGKGVAKAGKAGKGQGKAKGKAPVAAAAAAPKAAAPKAAPPPPPPSASVPKGGKVHALKSAKELEEILQAVPKGQLVVLDFTASWCGPCQQIAPVFGRLAAAVPHALFVKVDADTHGGLVRSYGVKAFPTIVLLKGKSEVSRMQGADPNKLETSVKTHAGKPDPWATAKKTTGRTLR